MVVWQNGENVAEAVAALQDLPVSGFLEDCCAPESITAIMPQLPATGAQWLNYCQ
jgi:S-methylmethionine-dependent homocysteine/selenocysteine methylase